VNDQSHDIHDEGTTVSEAARILGITEGAVRKRVERGKLAAEHTQDGRLMVYLGRDTTTTDTTRDRPRQSRDASEADDRYIRSLEEQVQYLRSQLEQEREARTEERRRQDTVVAQLSRANEEQARTIRELEAPAEPPLDERETPQTVEEESERAEPRPDTSEAQEGVQRPWWRRVFGG
jgi:predicted transcriptional regulator